MPDKPLIRSRGWQESKAMMAGEMTWRRISVHRVVSEWLRAEGHRLEIKLADPQQRDAVNRMIRQPDLGNPVENRIRLRLLYVLRMDIWVELPPDMEWFEVSGFGHEHVTGLRVINSREWLDGSSDRCVRKNAALRAIALSSEPATWALPILFGTTGNGPFTIIEGNNRLTAYVGSGRRDFPGRVIIGISPTDCIWNGAIAGPVSTLMRDLIENRTSLRTTAKRAL